MRSRWISDTEKRVLLVMMLLLLLFFAGVGGGGGGADEKLAVSSIRYNLLNHGVKKLENHDQK